MKTLKILLITAFAFVASAATASTEFNQFDQERIAVHDDQCSMDVVAVVESSAYVMSAKTLHSLETAEEITFESFDVYTVSIMGVPQHPELIHRHLATNYSMFKISNANQFDQERIAVHDDQCSMDVVAVVESSAYVMSAKTLHSLETAEEITFESFDVYTVSIMGVPQHPELIHRHLATNYSMFKISNANQKDPNEPKGEVIPDLDFWGCSVPWNVVDKILGKFD